MLIQKLINKNVSNGVINAIIKIFKSSKVSVNLRDTININSGLGQGKLCSPAQFNIFIDDLIDLTEKICQRVLAFADDTAFLCYNIEELLSIIDTIEGWSRKNLIGINKKKSGIFNYKRRRER